MNLIKDLGKGKGVSFDNVNLNDFFLLRFYRKPEQDPRYYKTWLNRFWSGQPTVFMDNLSLKTFNTLKSLKRKYKQLKAQYLKPYIVTKGKHKGTYFFIKLGNKVFAYRSPEIGRASYGELIDIFNSKSEALKRIRKLR